MDRLGSHIKEQMVCVNARGYRLDVTVTEDEQLYY